MALNYLDKAAWDAGVYKDKSNDDDTQQDTSSEDSGYSASGILSAAKNFLEHPFQGMGTVIAPNYTPRPLDDSVYSDIPGTPVASGQFGELEDESVRDERMKDSADYMAANWPRLYGGAVAADEGLANVVGGIQNAVGGGNGILTNVQRAEEGMQNYRDQWNNEYGDSYFLNPNKFATDVGSGIGSTVPIMALSALMPGAAVAGGTRALTSALSRAGLGRLAMSKAGQALIADTVRSPISSLADSLSEYGTVVNDMMQDGMSEDEARRRAIPMFFKNMALDTFTVPLELGVMKGGKGIATSLLGRSAGEGMAKSIAKGAARTGMLAGASGLTEGYQEGAQNALENDVEGNRDGGWYNPFTWTNEDWEAARGGFVGGALMGVPGNVVAGFHPEARQAPLSAESQEQAQSIKDTLSHGKPAGMSNAAYNAYIELANSGNPDLIKQAASSLESFQQSQEGSQESTDYAATEAYKDYETYDQKQEIENFLNNNTVEQIGGEDNFNWLMGVLRNGTPEEVQHAYDTVIAAEKATAEQEAKNRPASGGGSMSPNTGNAMANIVIQAANDSGVDPRLGLAIAARESGGDDVNAISMPPPHDGVYGVMQAQEETVSNMGLDSQYPDWKTDPYQNAMVGMAILKAKIDGENGDVWAGVRDYDGAGEEAEQYRQLVKNNYDNMGDIGGGGGSATYDGLQLTLPDSDEFTDQSGNVSGLTEDTRMKLRVLDNLCYQKFGQHLIVSSSYREGDPNNHGAGVAFDVSGGIVDDPDARQWLEQAGPAVGLFVIPEYQGEAGAEFARGDNVHFSNVEPGIYGQTRNAEGHWSEEHAASSIQSILKGGASSGVSGKVTSDNGQFERELDQAAQEAKSDMDKIKAQSDQAMNDIMNDDSAEKTAQDAQQDAENAQKQAEESQQNAQDDVVPDVAQTIRDTSNNIDEINTLDGMFTKDSNGNDKFIDTPENRDFIKANYKDEITKAVNDAMSKKKAPSATPVPKTQQQTPHARLGRILSTYDRKDPKFKEYMNTFRNGTEQEQQKLADDLQTTQELERTNSLKGNPLTTQQDQNAPQNAPQQAVETPEQTEQVNTPVQAKESLETQKKRKIYLAKKQKLMERVPAGKTVKVHASTNDAGFDATYKIVPAGDITASHDMNYAVNDLYPAEYQPRDRNRPQMRGQVEKMTKGMKPELLAESQFVNEGAPVVNNSGVVLNGNGRVMAIQKAYKGLTDAHKKSAKAYKDYLISIAPSLGIAPEKVQSMDHPVLVRQAADNADTNAIINSTEGGAKLGGAEQAKADADRLKLSTLEQFVDNGTGEFMNPSNREFRRDAASDVFSDAEGNSVFNEKGDLSPTGAFRIRNAIFAKAYNDNYLLTQLSEATDNNSKNIMNAMIAAAPEVAKVNEGIKNGILYPDYDISDVITKTAKTIMSLRNEGKPLSFHLQETDLFSQGESEAERLVLEFIERNKFKSRTIADMYKGACDRIFAVGSPKQSKLFDSKEAPRISLENIISNAIQEVEHGQSLFDTTEEKPAEKAVSEVPDNRQAEPAGSGRIHQQEAGRVQSQEKEGNEVDEKSKQSDHVDTEPQQTESKDKESSHAEEGPQSDVQEEISKFHNVLNDEKSTPKQVIDAYKSVVDKATANANGSRKNAKIGDKIVTDEYQYLANSKHWDAFMNEDGGRNWHEAATINAGAHKTLRAIIKTAGKKTAPKAEQPKETKPTEQPKEKPAGGFTDDEIKTLTDSGFNRWTKKLPNGKVMDRLYIKPEYLGLELTRYKSGNISSATFNGETISNSEARRIEGTKCYVDIATKEVVCDREDLKQAAQEVVDNVLSKEKPQVLAQAETKKAAQKDSVQEELTVKEAQNDADIRFGTVEEAEARGRIDIAADDVSELFDRIEGMNMPERLDMSDEKKQASIRKAGQQLSRSKEELKAEIKEAFPNAKEIKDEGDRMTFTMPNGSHIVVDLKNEILLTDKELAQAKKDHHIDDNGNVIVEGYAQLHGKDAYMALSQGSRENTGFHEAYHLAEGAVLTDREKSAIKKAIPDAEKRADKYAEWVEARKHVRGTAWGKLFQKIKDFAVKMRKIFTGVETVNDIFRQIESGKVWERGARDNNERRYAVRQDDQEEAPVKPQDIIDAINDIVHIYEGSRLTDKERKELRESSKFDPDQKQAVRPQATDLYDHHAHAGFNRMGYFNLSNYGRILALHLDNIMQLKGNLELANKVLDRQDKNAAENKMNGVNEHLTPAQARQNAVMDFGAMMIRNPELARETYPAYSKIFDEGLEQHPDLKEKLDKVIQLNETYQGQTAAERAAGSIAREKEKVQLRKHPKEWLHTHFDKFYTNWVDDKHIFAKVVARAEAELGRKLAYDYDVHKQAQMAINVASSRALLFLTGGKGVEETYKVLNKVYGHAITKNVTMKDIMDALNKVSKEDVSKTGAENAYNALGNYLIAMRTEELEKHYHDAYARSAGFDEEGTQEIIQNTPESIKKIAQMYWDINTSIVNILQQQGLISKDLAGKLRKYKHYCPMYRDMSDGITDMDEMIGTIGVFNKGGGYANVSNGIKRIEGGGKRPILDPITSLSQMAVSMISKCERNDVAKTFVKLGQDFSGLGDVVVRDPTLKHADPTAFAFTVWQNGEQVVYRTTPEIYDALTNNDAQTNRFTIKMASSIAQTLRTGATISPSFIVRNLLRDTMSATVNSKTGFYLPFVDNVRGAWKLHFDKEFSAEYHASGASMSTYMRADADSSRDLTKELLGHKYDSYPVVVKQVRQLISYAWHKYEKFGNLIEDSTRAGEFRRARKQGLSIDQAGQLAREITLDFSRHGKKGQIVNKYVPFFNATIQGTDKFIRTFKDNPMRAILNTVIWIILPSLGLWAINHDDDWYKELDENTKYTNWAIPLPGGTHLLIPKPQEVGILFGSGIEAVLNQMTGTDPHGMKEWARQYAEAMTPSLYPAVVRPLIEWMTNYSFWTGRNLVPASLQKAPSEMQFTSYTSELAKSLGDTWLAKSIKLSPIAIDNWISGWFGSAGRFIANMLNDPISYVRGNSRPSEPAKYWYEMPVIGSFVRQNGQNSEYVNRMYEIQKDMNDDYERSDAGKQRKGKKSSSNKPKELKQVDTAVSSVSKLNKEIKAIRNDPKKDPDRKRQEIDQRRTKINDLAKKVVLKFDK
ncbi:LPD38 domain-containing protein [Megasphaera sp.]|uniref:LPD38 domain-containing protein n=1 Tax=Megasphaera sp. TaxID=2023260 RepID=UPI0025C5A103|nr:LPD38 domain-containing protein [Megasphaera sp.]